MDITNTHRLYATLPLLERGNACAEVDLSALQENFSLLSASVRQRAPHARVIAVVKADAYGHGAVPCVRALLRKGCDFFAVSCLEEAKVVRAACVCEGQDADILIFGYTAPAYVKELADLSLTQSLLSFTYACELHARAEQEGVCLKTHVAVDTGMNRVGFCAHDEQEVAESAAWIKEVCAFSHFSVTGMFTHFARADEEGDDARKSNEKQVSRYRALKQCLESQGVTIPFHHVCNGAAAMQKDGDLFDGIRPGLLLYGATASAGCALPVRPVMHFCTHIVHLHRLLPGECVGYGGLFSSDTMRTVAVIPVGYADGLMRTFRGGSLLVHTKVGDYTASIIGSVCIDQCMLDVTDIPTQEGDMVTVFGRKPCTVEAMAQHAGTIGYELLCAVSGRVPRVYLNDL